MILINLILAFLICLWASANHPVKNLPRSITIFVVSFLAVSYLSNKYQQVKEGFGFGGGGGVDGLGVIDDSRQVRYGDTVLLFSFQNTYLRANPNGTIDTNSRLNLPSEIPRTWQWEYFIIEDANGPSGPANSGFVKYGDKVFLRTWSWSYLSSSGTGDLSHKSSRTVNEQWTITTQDNISNAGKILRFGDNFSLKSNSTGGSGFVSSINGSTNNTVISAIDNTCQFSIYDRYGQGLNVDWAQRGTATQSSTYVKVNYPPYNAIDGNIMSFSCTEKEQGAWWQVQLPKEVLIEKIMIKNRQDGGDSVTGRLANFDIFIQDVLGNTIASFYQQQSKDNYLIDGIGKIGRIVKIQLRGTNYLQLAEVQVFGKGVDYSILLNKPTMSELITEETTLTETSSKTIFNEDIPYVASSMTISGFVKFTGNNRGTRTILSKGMQQFAPLISVKDGKLSVKLTNKSSKASASTDATVTQELVSNNVLPTNQWFHLAVVINSGISPDTGWQSGYFTSVPSQAPFNNACCYIMNPILKQWYYLGAFGVFDGVKQNVWDVSVTNNMTYMGTLDPAKSNSTVTVYLNGNKDSELILQGTPVFNSSSMMIGNNSNVNSNSNSTPSETFSGLEGANFQINRLKVYNYAVPELQIRYDSKNPLITTSYVVVRGVINISNEIVVPVNQLPDIDSEFTISCWIQSNRPNTGTGSQQPIYWFGVDSVANAIFSTIFANNDNSIVTNSNNLNLVKIPKGIWTHLAQVYSHGSVATFVNGELMMQIKLQNDADMTIANLHLGGNKLDANINDCRLSTYALTQSEIKGIASIHPDGQYRDIINSRWKLSGCTADLFQSDDHADLIKLAQNNKLDLIDRVFKDLKSRSDKGESSSRKMCIGNGNGNSGFGQTLCLPSTTANDSQYLALQQEFADLKKQKQQSDAKAKELAKKLNKTQEYQPELEQLYEETHNKLSELSVAEEVATEAVYNGVPAKYVKKFIHDVSKKSKKSHKSNKSHKSESHKSETRTIRTDAATCARLKKCKGRPGFSKLLDKFRS